MSDYDIGSVFREIELSLIRSMSRSLASHNNEVLDEGFDWTMWQAEKIQNIEQFMAEENIVCREKFKEVNSEIDKLLNKMYSTGMNSEEKKILSAIKVGYFTRAKTSEFNGINRNRLKALIKAVKGDMRKAETAMLRMVDDVYRKVVFNAEVYHSTGATTLNSAVDMATRDFLSRGINCIEYENGARVGIDSYAEMALRTAGTRAKLQGESAVRDEYGINTIIVTARSVACPMCSEWIGKVLYDDVYSNIEITDSKYPRLSEAMNAGLYHPNCKDSHTTYFEGVNTQSGQGLTDTEKAEAERVYRLQQQQRYNERMIRKYKRLEVGSVSPDNIERYGAKRAEWQKRQRDLISRNNGVLHRDYSREKIMPQ